MHEIATNMVSGKRLHHFRIELRVVSMFRVTGATVSHGGACQGPDAVLLEPKRVVSGHWTLVPYPRLSLDFGACCPKAPDRLLQSRSWPESKYRGFTQLFSVVVPCGPYGRRFSGNRLQPLKSSD